MSPLRYSFRWIKFLVLLNQNLRTYRFVRIRLFSVSRSIKTDSQFGSAHDQFPVHAHNVTTVMTVYTIKTKWGSFEFEIIFFHVLLLKTAKARNRICFDAKVIIRLKCWRPLAASWPKLCRRLWPTRVRAAALISFEYGSPCTRHATTRALTTKFHQNFFHSSRTDYRTHQSQWVCCATKSHRRGICPVSNVIPEMFELHQTNTHYTSLNQ